LTDKAGAGIWVYDDTQHEGPLVTELPLAAAGDVNKDRRADLIVIAEDNTAYLVYGRSTPGSLSLTSLSPASGFPLLTPLPGDALVSVTAVGDVNGDGSIDFLACDDALVEGNRVRTSAFVVFGAPMPTTTNLHALTGRGFEIGPPRAGVVCGGEGA
jgi:hypothetical protein